MEYLTAGNITQNDLCQLSGASEAATAFNVLLLYVTLYRKTGKKVMTGTVF